MVVTWKWADAQGEQGTKSSCQISGPVTGKMTVAPPA